MTNLTEQIDDQRKIINLLFIARTYPPLVGGMEKFAQDFYQHMDKLCQITLIANPIGKKHIVIFFINTLFFLIKHCKEYDIIHFNDAILSPLVIMIRMFSKAKVTVTVHGLDIVYKRYGYQFLVIPFLRKADRIFPVSEFTKQQCIQRNIPEEKLIIISNGVNFQNLPECHDSIKETLYENIISKFHNGTILLSLGRLINRKGHVWFLNNVFNELPDTYHYIIAGDGPEYENIRKTINKLSIRDRVIQLGIVSEAEKACLFQMSDLFIMPNIIDKNDQEGFGIVLIEAASFGLPCIASEIEGIPDAVIDNVSGVLVKEKDVQSFLNAIINSSFNRNAITQKIREKYNWKNISQIYYTEFTKLLQD